MADWIEVNKPWRELDAKAGILVDVDDEGDRNVYLIGHINEKTGTCGCCEAFMGPKVMLLRYKIVWTQEEEL